MAHRKLVAEESGRSVILCLSSPLYFNLAMLAIWRKPVRRDLSVWQPSNVASFCHSPCTP
eukprot:scaffold10759_cov149-Isochrysis_galbana.AAC.1